MEGCFGLRRSELDFPHKRMNRYHFHLLYHLNSSNYWNGLGLGIGSCSVQQLHSCWVDPGADAAVAVGAAAAAAVWSMRL